MAVIVGLAVALPMKRAHRRVPAHVAPKAPKVPVTNEVIDTGIDEADGDMLIEVANRQQSTCPIWSDKIVQKLGITDEQLADLVSEGQDSNIAFEFMVFCVLDGLAMDDRLDILRSGIQHQDNELADY